MTDKTVKNIIEVAPLTRIPLSRNQSFSYLSGTTIPPGSLVSVPLFRRTVEGIVLSHKPDFARLGNIELKKVSALIEDSFLDEKQLALADFISDYYFAPLGIVLKSFVPKRVKARINKSIIKTSHVIPKTDPIILTEAQKKAVAIITKSQETKSKQTAKNNSQKISSKISNFKPCLPAGRFQISNYLLLGPAGSGKTEIYIEAIKKLPKDKQALILLPELTLTPQAIERYGQHFTESEIAVFTSKISKGAFYDKWKKIRSGEVRIIIGTRMAVFAPFKDLGLIVVDEEQDMSHKQWDMTPRYDARTVAEKLAEIHHSRIISGSATPSLEAYHKTLIKEAILVEIPHLEIPGAKKKNYVGPQMEIVDMRKERWKSGWQGKIINTSPLSRKLQSEIAYALKNKLQTILFINRQGMSNFSICTTCKNVLRCPTCESALVYDSSGVYRCSHCNFRTSITAQCSKCGSLEFKNLGLGTQKIEREITALFPGARTARLDSETARTPHFQEKIYQEFSDGKVDILIGTQMITKGWDLPNVALIGIIDADNMLSIPDFSTSVRAFQNIVQVAGRSDRPHSKWRGMVIIQTYNPQQEIFKAVVKRDPNDFFASELEDRKALHLPPFGKIIKLVFQDYDRKKVSAETEKVFQKLKASDSLNYHAVTEPQESYIPNIRGRYRKQIVIKLKNGPLSPELKNIIASLPPGWLVDVDPISII